jgi:hypothetical protein
MLCIKKDSESCNDGVCGFFCQLTFFLYLLSTRKTFYEAFDNAALVYKALCQVPSVHMLVRTTDEVRFLCRVKMLIFYIS